jgi:hypothetical protein
MCPEAPVTATSQPPELHRSISAPIINRPNFEAEFMRDDSRIAGAQTEQSLPNLPSHMSRGSAVKRQIFEADTTRNDSEGLEEMDFSRRSEPDRKNRTFECSEMSISFLPPETTHQSFANVLDEFDSVLPKKRCSELDVISRKMDEIINWFSARQQEKQKSENKALVEQQQEENSQEMDVVQTEPEQPLSPIAQKLREIGRR